MKLRPYQQDAVDLTIEHIKKCFDPCLLELATGAGKSLIVAEIARWIEEKSSKKVLCLAPSKELVLQNREKYLSYGKPASIFSASGGGKCLKNNVVFGSPRTVMNSINRFGSQFAAVIIDEAHGVTPTIKNIVNSMKEHNPMLRVIGLTATPYRTGSGYIYEVDDNGIAVDEDETVNPYFKKLLYRVDADLLISQGYLTKPVADLYDGYDTSKLELSGKGFTNESVEQAFEGLGRVTSQIVSQIVDISRDRKGVIIFAATVQHAKEVMESLPNGAEMITGDTVDSERDDIIRRFKLMQIKYLVNVAVLTTGFDAPHIDVVAILRATESPGLLQQIIGRGLRIHPDKKDCLILDYAENITRHGLEDNLFKPVIKASKSSSGDKISVICKVCNNENLFSTRPNKEDFEINEDGNFVDLSGREILISEMPLPAHYGRRCQNYELNPETHSLEQCNGRWSFKECHECDADNDIAARYCKECKTELVDPNEKLKLDFTRMKKDPRTFSSDKVISWYAQPWVSRAGNETLRIDWKTEYRSFSAWYSPESKSSEGQALWEDLSKAVFNGRVAPSIEKFANALNKGFGVMPKTITSAKRGDFFKVIAHNSPEDIEP